MGDPTLAEWWERLLARLIDGTILSVIISPAYVLLVFSISDDFLAIMRRSAEGRLVDVQDLLALEVTTLKWGFLMAPIAAVLYFVYDGIQHAVWGRTLGKRLLKIEVIAMSTRVRVTRGAAWRRAAVYALPPAVPIIGSLFALANGLWLFQDPMARQCLHDKAAGTVVVKARGPGTTTPV
ncbi:RDD family protein [Planotetraspora phitsanulokensis]|uniref:RDD family protein n=1 Tax=Planotetraspora phitsanulokensis TaxID=575192 RepID=UPI0019509388|nr:RDD family protein [Planotetraspora phitsanulokensis]